MKSGAGLLIIVNIVNPMVAEPLPDMILGHACDPNDAQERPGGLSSDGQCSMGGFSDSTAPSMPRKRQCSTTSWVRTTAKL